MRYAAYLTAVCEHDGRTLKLANFYLFKEFSIKPATWRNRAGKGELQVRRVGKAAGRIGEQKGKFEVIMEVFEVTSALLWGNEPRKRLWVRPEYARVADHIEELQAHTSVLRGSSAKTGDAPYKEAEKLEQQARQIVFTIARNAVEIFVNLEKQVVEAKKAAEQDVTRASGKTADDIVQLHGHITSSLLADGEEILRQLTEER